MTKHLTSTQETTRPDTVKWTRGSSSPPTSQSQTVYQVRNIADISYDSLLHMMQFRDRLWHTQFRWQIVTNAIQMKACDIRNVDDSLWHKHAVQIAAFEIRNSYDSLWIVSATVTTQMMPLPPKWRRGNFTTVVCRDGRYAYRCPNLTSFSSLRH